MQMIFLIARLCAAAPAFALILMATSAEIGAQESIRSQLELLSELPNGSGRCGLLSQSLYSQVRKQGQTGVKIEVGELPLGTRDLIVIYDSAGRSVRYVESTYYTDSPGIDIAACVGANLLSADSVDGFQYRITVTAGGVSSRAYGPLDAAQRERVLALTHWVGNNCRVEITPGAEQRPSQAVPGGG